MSFKSFWVSVLGFNSALASSASLPKLETFPRVPKDYLHRSHPNPFPSRCSIAQNEISEEFVKCELLIYQAPRLHQPPTMLSLRAFARWAPRTTSRIASYSTRTAFRPALRSTFKPNAVVSLRAQPLTAYFSSTGSRLDDAGQELAAKLEKEMELELVSLSTTRTVVPKMLTLRDDVEARTTNQQPTRTRTCRPSFPRTNIGQ